METNVTQGMYQPHDLILSNGIQISYLVISSVALILNISCIITIKKQSRSMKPFEILLTNMMAADIIVALTGILLVATLLTGIGETKAVGFMVVTFLFAATVQAMALFVFVISVDRLLAVKYPIRHHLYMSPYKTSIASIIVWLLWAIYLAILFIIRYFSKTIENPFEIPDAPRMTFIVLACSFVVIFLLLNVAIVWLIMRKGKDIKRKASKRFMTKSKEVSLSFTTFIIVASFCICTGPRVYQLASKKGTEITFFGILANTIINPVIYFIKSHIEKCICQKNRVSQCQRNKNNKGREENSN